MSQLRIIGGAWRGRRLNFHGSEALRPSLDFVRETLFNWLQGMLHEAVCLDAFAGSGALGFEALSRGAKSVYLMDLAPSAIRDLQENAQVLKALDRATFRLGSALTFLKEAKVSPFNLIFLDPPFCSGLMEASLALIIEREWLIPEGFVYFEAECGLKLTLPAGWRFHRHKYTGVVQYGLLTREA